MANINRVFSIGINTRYVGATETKPARIRAEFNDKVIFMPYDYEYDINRNHHKAAIQCLKKYNIDFSLEHHQLLSAWNKNDQFHIVYMV